MKIKYKLSLVFISLQILTLFILGLLFYLDTKENIHQRIKGEINQTSNHILEITRFHIDNTQKIIDKDIENIETTLAKEQFTLDQDNIATFKAENQITHKKTSVVLPAMVYGNNIITGTNELIDQLAKNTKARVTIFQLIPQGLLRISTTVKNKNGNRTLGTYIPTNSPVYKAIIAGKSFKGRAFEVVDWYITHYKPIFNHRSEVIGAIYIGIKQSNLKSLKKIIYKMSFMGKSYTYIIDSKANVIVHFDKKLEGHNFYKIPDENGKYFVQEILSQKKKKGVRVSYLWKDHSSGSIDRKYAYFRYLQEMDWIVVMGINDSDLYKHLYEMRINIIIVLGILLIILIPVTFFK